MKNTLLTLLKEKGMKPVDLALILDVPVSNIYRWNKEGISEQSRYYEKIKKILPALEPNGKTQKIAKKGAKPRQLHLTEVEFERVTRPKKRYKPEYPKVIIKKKTN